MLTFTIKTSLLHDFIVIAFFDVAFLCKLDVFWSFLVCPFG